MAEKDQPQLSFLTRATLQILSGGCAGFMEVCIMQPLDVVKTRFQLQTKTTISPPLNPNQYYNGVLDCLVKMYKFEGLSSYWKGILPPIMVETPRRAIKFVCFEQYQTLFKFRPDMPAPITYALAGLAAGFTEAIVANPFEVVKITQQADRSRMKQAPPTWTVAKRIMKEEGFGRHGFYKGITAMMGRNGVFNMVYFGFYHSVKNVTKTYEDKRLEFLKKFSLAFTSGILASTANIPFDVAKSRIQGPQPIPGQRKYITTLQSMKLIVKEEGFRALYKGIVPKLMRLGPGGAIMILGYEYVYKYLERTLCS